MSIKYKIAAFLAGLAALIGGGMTLGSVTDDGVYNATSTSAAFGLSKVLKTGQGVFGSVVITGTGPGAVTLYDATTTNALLRTKVATTTLANFQTTATPGTYTFDVAFVEGLIVDFGGGTGTTTITWR